MPRLANKMKLAVQFTRFFWKHTRIPIAPNKGSKLTTMRASLIRCFDDDPTIRKPPRRHPATSAKLLVIASLNIPPFRYFNSNSTKK